MKQACCIRKECSLRKIERVKSFFAMDCGKAFVVSDFKDGLVDVALRCHCSPTKFCISLLYARAMRIMKGVRREVVRYGYGLRS